MTVSQGSWARYDFFNCSIWLKGFCVDLLKAGISMETKKYLHDFFAVIIDLMSQNVWFSVFGQQDALFAILV